MYPNCPAYSAEGSALESVALTVAAILLLQNPHHKSKSKDHISCLERRLKLWKDGDFTELLKEGRALQHRLPKRLPSKKSEEHLAWSFANLMFEGKTKAALQLLSNQGKGGVLHPDDTVTSSNGESLSVLEILRSKHPVGQPASANNTLQQSDGKPVDIHRRL